MESPFYLLLSLKTLEGYAAFGEFDLGSDQELAYALFDSLEGSTLIDDHCHFHIDLIETMGQLPGKIRSKCCRLEELSDNIKLIAREVFRQKNLKEE